MSCPQPTYSIRCQSLKTPADTIKGAVEEAIEINAGSRYLSVALDGSVTSLRCSRAVTATIVYTGRVVHRD